MEQTQQKKADDTPVVSPLAKDKTYGERVYHNVFDWGFNYWTNLLASAGFSQYTEHATRPIKLWGMKEAASPRAIQNDLAKWIDKKDWFMNGTIPIIKDIPVIKDWKFVKGFKAQMNEKYLLEPAKAAFEIDARSMARARSLTLLMPGFLIMIPAVWLGAKIKPWLVEKLDRRHYGDDAMTDPTLVARHQAIAAEVRPTFLGTCVARLGTMFAVQATAQLVGSKNNFVNKIGDKYNNESLKNFGIDPLTESVGSSIGGSLPEGLRKRYDTFASSKGLEASENQISNWLVKNKSYEKHLTCLNESHENYLINQLDRAEAAKALKPYSTATQDLGRFIAADTAYTLVSSLTIHPFVKLLRHVPFMSYKPKVAKEAAAPADTVNAIKVPKNHYVDTAPELTTDANAPSVTASPVAAEPAALDRSHDTPTQRVSHVREHVPAALITQPHEELATAR